MGHVCFQHPGNRGNLGNLGNLALLALMGVCLSGCSGKTSQPGTPDPLDTAHSRFISLGRHDPLRVEKDLPYMRARAVPYTGMTAPSLLETPVTLHAHATLPEIVAMIRETVPVTVVIAQESSDLRGTLPERRSGRSPEEASEPADPDGQSSGLPEIAGYFGQDPVKRGEARIRIDHEGPLVRLLDEIAALTGLGYEYEPEKNTITLARCTVRTYLLTTAPGEVMIANQLTNRSRDSQTGSGSGRIRSTQSSSDVKAEISQVYQGQLRFNVWEDTLKVVKTMLSRTGRCEGNQGAGTITVADHPENQRQIARYIREVNARYSLQVALKVNVYALEVADDTTTDLNLMALVPRLKLAGATMGVAGGMLRQAVAGSAQATILDGTFAGSQAFLQALNTIGRARQITSAGIVALNNQPAPVEAIRRISYLAGTSVEVTENGSETELTPGEVTTGFSMTITPHIVDRRKVVLQYNVHLASLDAMESFESNNVTIQLPRISSRAFSQKASMLMGQTLLVSGFQQATENSRRQLGLLSLGRTTGKEKSLILITIEVEDATPKTMGY